MNSIRGNLEMDDFNKLIKRKTEYKKAREDKYKEESKTRLSKIMKKKIETTMVGALSSIEDHLGHLFEVDGGIKDLYDIIRSEILDKGNAQARNVDAELNQYEVEWKKYQMEIPMKPQPSIRGTK